MSDVASAVNCRLGTQVAVTAARSSSCSWAIAAQVATAARTPWNDSSSVFKKS